MSELRKKVLYEAKRIVIKFGSKVLVDSEHKDGIKIERINKIVASIAKLHDAGYEIVIVTSGAVGAGMAILGYETKPKRLNEKQACASVGQIKLMHTYQAAFLRRKIVAGQILLSAVDFRNHDRYQNIQNTVKALLKKKVIPIINENDSIVTNEIKVGDNDKLSADVSQFLDADLLLLFSDENGLYDKNPKTYKDAKKMMLVTEITPEIMKLAGKKGESGSLISTGGMYSKLEAIHEVNLAGCNAVLANGNTVLPHQILEGDANLGTLFLAKPNKLNARKKWLSFVSKPKGSVTVDPGGVKALIEKNSSLLAVGIIKSSGSFKKGDLIEVLDVKDHTIARGITNFGKTDVDKISGKKSQEAKALVGIRWQEEVIHRNNMVKL